LNEEFATNVTYSYDKPTDRDITTFTLPVTSFIKSAKKDYSFGFRPPCSSPKFPTKTTKTESSPRTRYIVIDHERYSNSIIYKRSGNRFIPLNFRESTLLPITDNDQIFRFSKKTVNRDCLTFTFHRDVSVNSIILYPEFHQYEYVHSTAIRCEHRCTKLKHCINVLKNDPQYLSKFEVHYRSEYTNGQWVKHGEYNGSTSMFDEVRVEIEEVQMKELRIVPVTFYKGFNKIVIKAVGPSIHTEPVSTDLNVIYKVFTP
jgi:hypothetical protein